MQFGCKRVLVAGRIDLRDSLNAEKIEALMNGFGDELRSAAPDVHNVYLEPGAPSGRSSQ